MKNNSNKKKGFTLIETVISMLVVAIISGGLYGGYLLLIKNTKLAEEKQSLSLVGKRTLEDVNSAINDNKIVKKSSGEISIKDLGLLKNKDASKNKDELSVTGDEKAFKTRIGLDSNYNYCELTDSNCVYEEELAFEKVKPQRIGGAQPGNKADKANEDFSIDINKDNLDEQGDPINANIEQIDIEFSMKKEKGEGNESKIDCTEFNSSNNTKILGDSSTLILNADIEREGDNARISISDSTGNICGSAFSKRLDNIKINHLNLHFNFKEYFKEEKEKLKDLKINVRNGIKDTDKVVVNVFIEKSVDLKVNVVPTREKIYMTQREDDKDIKKVGPLYHITVKIAPKGTFAESDNNKSDTNNESDKNKKDEKILFTGYSSKNINIKQNA